MKNLLSLYPVIFVLLFVGRTLASIVGCIIYGYSDGSILSRISELPYGIYAVMALIAAAVVWFMIYCLCNPKKRK